MERERLREELRKELVGVEGRVRKEVEEKLLGEHKRLLADR